MSDLYKFQFRLYRRSFNQPLQTSHGMWRIREGIIISLVDDDGKISWGEIAPVPWFGSETLEQALQFCQQLGSTISITTIDSIPVCLPACQFGFESALELLNSQTTDLESSDRLELAKSLDYCYLLPTGQQAVTVAEIIWQQQSNQIAQFALKSASTFKWKIGIKPHTEEVAIFKRLLQALPSKAKLRLDANGALTEEDAKRWLKVSEQSKQIEFIEQPLAPQHFDRMLNLSERYQTPLALDESVATLDRLKDCYQKGWREIFVIKPAICGSPNQLRHFCRQYSIDAVFSSVFETEIGRKAALKLARELNYSDRALGFGVEKWLS